MNKKTKALSLITAAGLAMGITAASAAAETYRDVPETHWAYNAIERCSMQNWFSGYPDGTFRPDAKIDRAEAMKVFVTFMGENVQPVTSTSYHDVSPTEWYAPFIEAGKDLFPKRTTMTSELKFQPKMPILREDTVYALVKAKRYDKLTEMADLSVLNMFSDQNSISSICKPYLAVAVSNGLVAGYNDGTIKAQEPLTRAQFATLLYRATNIGELVTDNKVLQSISIEPSTLKQIEVGESFEIKATASYSDKSTQDYSLNLNPYTDSEDGIVNINRNKITGIGAGTVIIKFNNKDVKDKQLVVEVKATATPEPTAEPTPEPTAEPTPEPTAEPTVEPTAEPSSDTE